MLIAPSFVCAQKSQVDGASARQSSSGEQGGAPQKGKLAQASQNPISSLISIPFQLNFNGGIGPFDRTQTILNLQPVIPIRLSENLTLVTRVILPFVSVPAPALPTESTWGFGDVNPQVYLAFALPGGFTFGPGVTGVVPTETEAQLGLGRWQVGPSLVMVWIGGPFVIGFLINNAFSVGNSDRPEVNAFYLQPFLNVNLPQGTYLTTAPQITNDWDRDDAWTLPVGLGVGQVLQLGPQPANLSVQAYANVIAPERGPGWTLRLQLQLLFPVEKRKD